MNKKNKILNLLVIIISCSIVFCIAKSRYVNRMPTIDIDYNNIIGYQYIGQSNIPIPIYAETATNYTFFDNVYDLFLGRGFLTLVTALITVIISFIINKLFIKQELKLKNYILLFFVIFILNIIIYIIGINVVF